MCLYITLKLCAHKWLGVIMIRGDPYEVFLSYGYVEARSKVSCSSFKHPLRNMFQGTAF